VRDVDERVRGSAVPAVCHEDCVGPSCDALQFVADECARELDVGGVVGDERSVRVRD
jgi:hypothetical protein